MMQAIRHETCQQYIARRLSEGWQIVWQQGYHLILSSPDGNILRPVDLRNDVETLRPNAAGDSTECSQYPDTGENWDKVDEEIPDEFDTRIAGEPFDTYRRDLYNLPASSGSGTINFIKIYFRSYTGAGKKAYAKPSLKSDGVITDGTEVALTGSWVTYSEQWNTNPADGEAWEWADIDALQIGVSLKSVEWGAHCTQVYVEVDYTPPAVGRSFGYIIG